MRIAPPTLVTVTISVVLLLMACSSRTETDMPPADPFEVLANRSAAATGSFSMTPESLETTLPNVTYTLLGANDAVIVSAPFSDAVLTGHFTSSAVYSSTTWDEDDSSTIVGENDPADTRILNLNFASDEVIAAGEGTVVPAVVAVAIVIPGDVDAKWFGQELINMGDAILFLEEPYKQPNGAGWTVSLGGTMIGQISTEDEVSFPVLTHLQNNSSAGSFSQLEDKTTLSAIKRAAALPPREIVE